MFGRDIVKENVEIRRRVGYLAQDPRYYEYMTARETLRFTARFFYEGPRTEIEKRVAETLELVGLADKADRPIKGFSGGERQRLGIAQAQINYPDLLILDEPAASLDPIGRPDVLEVMERLRKHTTIFYSTHILDDVQRVSDTVIILNQGALVAQGPIEEILAWGQAAVFSLTVKGNGAAVETRLRSQRWVTGIETLSKLIPCGKPSAVSSWAWSYSSPPSRFLMAWRSSLDVLQERCCLNRFCYCKRKYLRRAPNTGSTRRLRLAPLGLPPVSQPVGSSQIERN